MTSRRDTLRIGSLAISAAIAGCLEDSRQDDGDRGNDKTDNTTDQNGSEPSEDDEKEETPTNEENNRENENDDNKQEPDEYEDPNQEELSIQETSFEVHSADCGEGANTAHVSRNDNEVTIEGVIDGNNACYTADLEDASTDGDDLVIFVKSFEESEEGGMCAQCISDIEYTAIVHVSKLPKQVIVKHNTEEVTID